MCWYYHSPTSNLISRRVSLVNIAWKQDCDSNLNLSFERKRVKEKKSNWALKSA